MAIRVEREEDPRRYAERVLPFLERTAARHNLMVGILDLLQRRPEVHPTFHLWLVLNGSEVVGAALQTVPYPMVVAIEPEMASVLADAIGAAEVRLPGVFGPLPDAPAFADVWTSRTGSRAEAVTRQGVYELREVRDAGDAPGRARRPTADEVGLLVAWNEAFVDEAVPNPVGDPESRRRRMSAMVEEGGYLLWEDDDRPVSMTGVSAAPPSWSRVGPVYTPPELRSRGYATALVAHASAQELASGRAACFLHTDLANPTSNAIYQRIGYDWVCEAVDLRFVDQSQPGGVGA